MMAKVLGTLEIYIIRERALLRDDIREKSSSANEKRAAGCGAKIHRGNGVGYV
jgi:hypothetical protein